MLGILKDPYFSEHQANGFVETGISLEEDLVEEIKEHYLTKALGHNDFPKFFVDNQHQAYLEGAVLGFVFNTFPGAAKKLVKRFYDKAYSKAVYCDQACMEKVLAQLMKQDFQRLFETRYIVASYDMYLRNSHRSPAAGIHTDLPNFHHFYETENDLSLYIPLVDLDDDNGGRLSVLPESKLKVAGNVLLKLLYEHFSQIPECLDEKGYVDPDRITARQMAAFIRSKPHQDLMTLYKGVIPLAKKQYAGDFRRTEEGRGRVLMFNNKNFHAAERWKNEQVDREVYVIRMFPLYDARIRLRQKLHGTPVNNFLLDMQEGVVHRYPHPVDVTAIPEAEKLRL
ncbi:MAG: hypothetical protein WD341_13945 [Tistlia sp.]|uniref:hypothetical protein n=1 Tax=Tistlia sp. TaxID=3057121 RepID=UPI0034A2C5D9